MWRKCVGCFMVGAVALSLTPVRGQVVVWVDFTSDIHDAAGGGPNGIPDWVDELDKATSLAGVTTFTPAERAVIEGKILSDLGTIYSGYTISFVLAEPGSGKFDAIAYGKTSFGFPALGVAPADPANIASSQVAAVATGNFDFILDEFTGSDSRATQIEQISRALAGTGAHELGHSLGMFHHDAYSHPGIHPATYGATGGLQNLHIMATGPTGLTEAGREVLRTLSPWERAKLDIAGGAADAYPTLDHHKMVSSPVLIDLTEVGAFDAGATFGTAMSVALTPGATSGFDLAFIAGDLDGSPGDMDMFKFDVARPGFLIAELFSENRFAAPFSFDATLTLYDSMGLPMATNDDVFYLDDKYGSEVFRQNDPFLLNIPIVTPGPYFLMVSGSPMPSIPAGVGDAYWLLIGVRAVPEPSLAVLWILGAGVVASTRRRRSPQSIG